MKLGPITLVKTKTVEQFYSLAAQFQNAANVLKEQNEKAIAVMMDLKHQNEALLKENRELRIEMELMKKSIWEVRGGAVM
ncbi:MAG: hypothetical protein KJ042_04640 [Deltaproteobacteria bacterium]|nr:hypothetical protein [Deltaproteobacteria bacterium]